jgi:type II secretory pathway pseudopilin PulG
MVELMVAMALMTIALMALVASFPYALYGVMVGGLQTTATFLAQEAIERVRIADYDAIASVDFDGSSGTLPDDCGGTLNLRPVPGFSGFRRCVSVRAGVPSTATTTITAVVEFSGANPGPPWRTTVTTVRAN